MTAGYVCCRRVREPGNNDRRDLFKCSSEGAVVNRPLKRRSLFLFSLIFRGQRIDKQLSTRIDRSKIVLFKALQRVGAVSVGNVNYGIPKKRGHQRSHNKFVTLEDSAFLKSGNTAYKRIVGYVIFSEDSFDSVYELFCICFRDKSNNAAIKGDNSVFICYCPRGIDNIGRNIVMSAFQVWRQRTVPVSGISAAVCRWRFSP